MYKSFSMELAGRTCYKSDDKITPTSAKKFVSALIKGKHFAMLEHAEVTFAIEKLDKSAMYCEISPVCRLPWARFTDWTDTCGVAYVTLSLSHLYNPIYAETPGIENFITVFENVFDDSIEVTTSTPHIYDEPLGFLRLRLIDPIREMAEMSDKQRAEFWKRHGSYTFKFVCDRGVSHELVRHRCSFAQESTRYCDYSKSEKFGSDIQFIEPANFDTWDEVSKEEFIHQLRNAESSYKCLTINGLTAQQARAVLPNALKTEVIMTAPVYQWNHFFDLRYFGTTGAPHPDMKVVAEQAYKQYKDAVDDVIFLNENK